MLLTRDEEVGGGTVVYYLKKTVLRRKMPQKVSTLAGFRQHPWSTWVPDHVRTLPRGLCPLLSEYLWHDWPRVTWRNSRVLATIRVSSSYAAVFTTKNSSFLLPWDRAQRAPWTSTLKCLFQLQENASVVSQQNCCLRRNYLLLQRSHKSLQERVTQTSTKGKVR